MKPCSPHLPIDPFKTSAFTLPELLAVVAILAILAVLITAGVNTVIDRAESATCAMRMRQMGLAHLAYRTDHGGKFAGFPMDPSNRPKINDFLVPNYLAELPLCPRAKKTLNSTEQKIYGTDKVYFQKTGGVYALNSILAQWNMESMPPSDDTYLRWWKTYWPSKTPMILEVPCEGSYTWSLSSHQGGTLAGKDALKIPPRYHGKKDALNFMFVDGHIELISRNDPRDVDESQKSWVYPTNPNGRFASESGGERYTQTAMLTDGDFEKKYGSKKE